MSSFFKTILTCLLVIGLTSCQSTTNESESKTSEPQRTESKIKGPVVPSNPENLLEGRWENIANDKEFIIFTATNMIRRFGSDDFKKDVITNDPFSFYEKCQGPCQIQVSDTSDTQSDCFSVNESGEFICYKVVKLTAAEFEFTKLDGSESIYKYKRIQ